MSWMSAIGSWLTGSDVETCQKQQQRVAEIFATIMELPAGQRETVLRTECAGDIGLLEEVQSLLRHHDNPAVVFPTEEILHDETFLTDLTGTCASLPERIGCYTILDVLGEGGMGIVYLAEQDTPRREVAIKIIRPGFSTPALMRRFEHEAHMLGRLQHPGIAQIHTVGTADTGYGRQPYLVMEYIDGPPLLEYVRQNDLSTRQRLELFLRICEPVQYAHQQGVIHRDLKPANILIDSGARPRMLDFGVACATNPEIQLTTIAASDGQLIGTLPYMSPEQIGGEQDEIDTRSDVYALGVILFELLSGRLPYDLHTSSIPEISRVIRDTEPIRLGSIDRSWRGDLETIQDKALAKDKARRYQAVSELAQDIKRYLDHEPIVARPASGLYQLKRFARRHRPLVAGVGAAFALLVLGVIGTSIGMVRAMTAQQLADQRLEQAERAQQLADEEAARAHLEASKAKRITEFLQSMLSAGDPGRAGRPDMLLREAVDTAIADIAVEFANDPDVAATIYLTIGNSYANLGEYEKADHAAQRAVELRKTIYGDSHPEFANSMLTRAAILHAAGSYADAERTTREALAMLGVEGAILHTPPARHTQAAQNSTALERSRTIDELRIRGLNRLVEIMLATGRLDESEQILREVLAERRQDGRAQDSWTYTFMNNLAHLMMQRARLDEAEVLLQETLEGRRALHGEEHPHYAIALNNLGLLKRRRGEHAAAESLYREALAIRTRIYGEDHRDTAQVLNNLGSVLRAQGRVIEAEESYRRAVESFRVTLSDHPSLAGALQNLASLRHDAGDLAAARTLHEEALTILRNGSDSIVEPVRMATVLTNYGKVLLDIAELDAAKEALEEALAIHRRVRPRGHPSTAISLQTLAMIESRRGNIDAAIPLFDESLATYRQTLGEEHEWYAIGLMSLGRSLLEHSRASEAEAPLREARMHLLEAGPEQHEHLHNCTKLLADCLTELRRADEAEALLRHWRPSAAESSPGRP